MRFGFAVKVLGEGGLPSHDARRWRSGPHLRHSLEALRAVFAYCARHEIRMYRMTAALAPYATHPGLPQFHGQVEACAGELAELGAVARALGLRLSTHPGQYVVLNSEDLDVRAGAARDLEVQAALLDAMGLGPEAVAVVHVGSGRGDALGRFEAGWATLSDAARARVVIENDDRVHALGAVLELHRRTGARVVWDVHHHHCHDPDGIPDREALALALATWPAGQTPKIHYSTPRTTMAAGKGKGWVLSPPRAHADLIDPFAFARFLEDVGERHFDVMLEAKGKDLALLRLREQLRPATTAPRPVRSAP